MKITTRAVFDMTDPAFWDGDMQDACIEEESFEYEGEVALCMQGDNFGDDGYGGSDVGTDRSDANGGFGGTDGGNGGTSWGSPAASLAHAEQQAGISHGFSSVGVDNSETSWNLMDGWHNRSTQAVKHGPLGGFMTTSYGWSHPQETARQYAAARNAQLSSANTMAASIPARIQSQWANNPAMQARLTDALAAGKLSELTAAGVMTADEASQMVNTHGNGLDRIGQVMGLSVDDLNMPAEAYITGLDKGLINPDGSITMKGLASTYGGLAGLAAGPVAGAIMSATGSLPAALTGYAGLKLGSGYARSQGMAGSAATEAIGMASSLAGAPGMVTDNLQQAANMAGVAQASAYGRGAGASVSAPEAREAGSGDNMFTDLMAGGSFSPVSSPVSTAVSSEPNNFALYKSRMGGSSGTSSRTGSLSGLSPTVQNMFSDLMA